MRPVNWQNLDIACNRYRTESPRLPVDWFDASGYPESLRRPTDWSDASGNSERLEIAGGHDLKTKAIPDKKACNDNASMNRKAYKDSASKKYRARFHSAFKNRCGSQGPGYWLRKANASNNKEN